MTSCYVFATAREFKSHWTRLNYGVIAVKSRTAYLTDGYETHTVEIKLPNLITIKPNSDNTTTGPTGPCNPLCNCLRVIANVTRAMTTSMQTSVFQLTQRIYDLIPDISEAPLGKDETESRSIFPWRTDSQLSIWDSGRFEFRRDETASS
jgi:hypothetical protein